MVKRILSATSSDFENMGRDDLLESIRLAEGRTVCAEVVATSPPLVYGVTNAETAAAFGADLISLNGYDVQNPLGLGATITDIKKLAGRPVGTKLDSVPVCSQVFAGSIRGRCDQFLCLMKGMV